MRPAPRGRSSRPVRAFIVAKLSPDRVDPRYTSDSSIRWPGRFRPSVAPVHVRNDIEVGASPERVWTKIVRATEWPAWYPNSADVALDGGGADLRAGAHFRWVTFGVRLRSTVEEFEPPFRLAWSARGTGVDVYHAWLITPTSAGCHVLTEESQHGFLARLDHVLRPHRMTKGHQMWLENLRSQVGREPDP